MSEKNEEPEFEVSESGRGRIYKHGRVNPSGTERKRHVVFPVSRAVGERLAGKSQKPGSAEDSSEDQQPAGEGADVDSD